MLATLLTPFLNFALLLPEQEDPLSPDQEIQAALLKADRDHKRVLLRLESEWCPDCLALEKLQRKRKIWKLLDYEYAVVRVELGKMDQNISLALRWAPDLETVGTPYWVVLDAQGKKLDSVGGAALYGEEPGPSAKVLSTFLKKNQTKPQVALKVLEEARLEAVRTKKQLFVHLGAPW